MLMIIAIFATFVVLAFQVVVWLKKGYWTPVSGEHFFEFFGIHSVNLEWRGLEKVLQLFFEIHIGFTFIAIALLLGFVLGAMEPERHNVNQETGYKHGNATGDTKHRAPERNKKTRRIKEEEKIEPKLFDNDRGGNERGRGR